MKMKLKMMILGRKFLTKSYSAILIFLTVTILLGIIISNLSLECAECAVIVALQSITQRTVGIPFFIFLTYLGDFGVWIIFSTVFFIYAFFKSRKNLGTSIKLLLYLTLITASTYLMKIAFARPRPNCLGITIYNQETFLGIPIQGGFLSDLDPFSYTSGHVSRATGSLIILSEKEVLPRQF